MAQLSNRVMSFTDSVIRRMTRISDEYGAINLSQGFPDWDPPQEITDALAEVAKEGPHQYSITFGADNLREVICKIESERFGRTVSPSEEIVITCGSTEAMMTCMMTVCNPGDKVVIFSPFYENYGADTILSGADPIFVPLTPPHFTFDKAELEAACAQPGVKALILCNPSNPCGKVFKRDELEFIADLAKKYDFYVVTDEVYEYITFDDNEHICMASLPGMFERTLTCNSLSKTYSITGWRLGYVIGNAEAIEAARKVHDFLTVGAAAPIQEAAFRALDSFGPEYYADLKVKYQSKRDIFLKGLDELGIEHTNPEGTYFVMIDISKFLELDQFKGMSDMDFCEWMIKNTGVAAVPGSSFFREPINHLIRLHFAREDETLYESLRRLKKMADLLK
ncbi:MAG: pyridoxal phosphate-dependent aminotransferase [Firmicutes bacterium]|nr:pyridoxal phosphate-dependent aminotransferase [Bacillota bacterium]